MRTERIDTLGGHQQVIVISEYGLFNLIFRSRKPDAKKFRRWVTGDVLPSIRRNETYVLPPSRLPAVAHPIIVKPFGDWTLEERRVALATVNTARLTLGQASAVWTYVHLGLPLPPRHLLPGWFQGQLWGDVTEVTAASRA